MTVVSLVVEGPGDSSAVPELVRRLAAHLERYEITTAPGPIMCKGLNILTAEGGVERFYDFAAAKPCEVVLMAVDCEDACIREVGAELNQRLENHGVTIPVALLLFHREYETIFLECLDELVAAKADLFDEKSIQQALVVLTRDAKTAFKIRLASKSYKETRDQVKFTALLDMTTARQKARAVKRCEAVLDWIAAGFPEPIKVIKAVE